MDADPFDNPMCKNTVDAESFQGLSSFIIHCKAAGNVLKTDGCF